MSNYAIWYHIITVSSLMMFKLAILFVGYLIAKLGYNLFIKGVSGEFKFHSEIKGLQADLVSASPGIFFILMATILIAIGVIKDKPFKTKVTEQVIQSGTERNVEKKDFELKPELPKLK